MASSLTRTAWAIGVMCVCTVMCVNAKDPQVKDVVGNPIEYGDEIHIMAGDSSYGGGMISDYSKLRRVYYIRLEENGNDVGETLKLEKVSIMEGIHVNLGERFYVKLESEKSGESGEKEKYWGLKKDGDVFYVVVVFEKERRSFAVIKLPGGVYGLQACSDSSSDTPCMSLGFCHEMGKYWICGSTTEAASFSFLHHKSRLAMVTQEEE